MWTPPRILVVDDNPENREIFRARLANPGYEILMARDGEEALAMAWAEGNATRMRLPAVSRFRSRPRVVVSPTCRGPRRYRTGEPEATPLHATPTGSATALASTAAPAE